MDNLKKLKSGTDIRGVASGLGGRPVDLTDEAVEKITAGFANWLLEKSGISPSALTVAVGHDSRISAGRIQSGVTKILTGVGITVLDCGLSSTPAMFMTTVRAGADAAVQITASHHPFDRNGLKFFTPEGGLDAPDITKILGFAEEAVIGADGQAPIGEVHRFDFMGEYAADLRNLICKGLGVSPEKKPLAGFHIVVDAGNGAGGFYATDVLKPLGADISGSQFLEPDGMFPNHIPNPEDKTAMESISAAVLRSGADFGVIFDTDVDRAACVDRLGQEINRNRLVALAAAIALEGEPGGTIVTDSITSSGLKLFFEETLGGRHYRHQRGYRNVINKAVELNRQGVDCPLAIETSGHAALRENYFLDDGAYLITKIIVRLAKLRAEGKELEDLIGGLRQPAEEKELRFAILPEDFRAYGLRVIDELERFSAAMPGWQIADDNREGIRVSTDGGKAWFLLRLSVHDPIMPMNLESDIPGGIAEICRELAPFFTRFDGLDCSPLDKLL